MSGYPVVVRVAGVTVDPCRVVLPLNVTHGRSTLNQQPDSPTCEFTWYGSTPPGPEGSVLTVHALAAIGEEARFVGRITALKAVESEGEVTSYEVTATGAQSMLGRQPVLLDRPQETDVARVQAIAAEAGIPVTVVGAVGPTLAADTIDTDALSALHEVCRSSGGLLWQDRAGVMRYGTMNHRSVLAAEVLPCSAILDGVDWTKDTDLVVNHVTAKWREPVFAPDATTSLYEAAPEDWALWMTLGTDSIPTAWSEVPLADPVLTVNHCNGVVSTYRLGRNSTTQASQIRLSTGTWVTVTDEAGANVTVSAFKAWVQGTGRVQLRMNGAVAVMRAGGSGGVQYADHQETYRDDDSITEWGRRHAEVSTLCASVDDVRLLGLLVLARRKQPRWRMPGVMVEPDKATEAERDASLRMDVSTPVLVPVGVDPSPTPAPAAEWFVEGWVHQWAGDGERVQYALSARAASETGGLTSWQGQRDGGTWADWATGSWLDQLT